MLIKINTTPTVTIMCPIGAGTPTGYHVYKAGGSQVVGSGSIASAYSYNTGGTPLTIYIATITFVATETDALGDLLIVVIDGSGNILGYVNATVITDLPGNWPSPNDILDAANGVEGGKSLRQALRLILAALAGKLDISGGVMTFRDVNDTKDRIVATTDATGRTTVTLDVS